MVKINHFEDNDSKVESLTNKYDKKFKKQTISPNSISNLAIPSDHNVDFTPKSSASSRRSILKPFTLLG